MLYICTMCGRTFETPIEHDAEWGEPYGYCPHCDSDGIEEAERCAGCDTYHMADALNGGYCYACLEKAERLLDEARRRWEDWVPKALDVLYDGRPISKEESK